jgi:hypothetical protein
MNRIARALTLSGCLALASGILMAATALPLCPPVTLTAGSAASHGMVQFTLVGSGNSSLFTVQVAVSAGDSGPVIAGKIAAAVNNSSWQAQVAPGGLVTFSYYSNNSGAWLAVSSITGLEDTAGASLKLSTFNVKSYVEFQLDSSAIASGHGSSVTFSVPGEAVPLSLGLYQGQGAASIVDAVAAYLNSAGPGVNSVRLSPTRIGIYLCYVHSFVSFQNNDAGLQGKATQSDQCVACADQTGLIQN